MKKILILLAVATLPAASGCCVARVCPCCPCNWFNRPVATCPPTYAAPMVASPCGPTYVPSQCAPSPCATCGPMAAPLAATVMPQYMAPPQQMMTQAQPMYFQQSQPAPCCAAAPVCCPSEPSCGCASEGSCGCGGPTMGAVSYGPMMDCNPCDSGCGGGGGGCSGCDGGGAGLPPAAPVGALPPAPQKFDPAPATE